MARHYYGIIRSPEYLAHYGILGMRWGHRKEPGSSGKRIFVSGSSKTQDKNSPYFRRRLPKSVRKAIKEAMRNGDSFIVGDAPGIDRQTQDYLRKKKYPAVDVYGPGKNVRYAADPKWKTHPIDSKYPVGSEKWLAVKDRAMGKDSTEGIAVILNKGSSATKNNILRMHKSGKPMKIWELTEGTGLIKGFEHPGDKSVSMYYKHNAKRNAYEPIYIGISKHTGTSKTSMQDYVKEHPYVMVYDNKNKKFIRKNRRI